LKVTAQDSAAAIATAFGGSAIKITRRIGDQAGVGTAPSSAF